MLESTPSTPSRVSPRGIRIALSLLLGLAGVWYLVFRLIVPLMAVPYQPGALHGNDFKHIYIGSQMLVRGQDPYDPAALFQAAERRGFDRMNPYVYLPFTGLTLAPLTVLDPVQALRAWLLLNHLMVLVALALLVFLFRQRAGVLSVLAAGLLFMAFSGPWGRTLSAGQINGVLLLGMVAVHILMERKHPLAAGLVAAFCFLFKLWPGILLVYFGWRMLGEYWRGRRVEARIFALALVSMIVASILFLGLSIGIVGLDQHKAFLPLLKEMSYGRSTWWQLGNQFYRDPYNQSFNAFFHHVLVPASTFRPWVTATPERANALTKLAVFVMAALVAWRSWPGKFVRPDESLVFSLYVLGGLLVPSIYWDHYAILLLLPFLALFVRLRCALRPVALVLFLILVLPTHFCSEILPHFGQALSLTARRFYTIMVVAQVAAVVLASAAAFLSRKWTGPGIFQACLWALAAAMVAARIPYSHDGLKGGGGLLLMSSALWGTLIGLGMSLWWAPGGKKQEENP